MSDLDRERAYWRGLARERPSRVPRPGPGQESVWDYPRPPRVEASASRVRLWFAGVKVADTRAALRVLETAGPPTYYLPRRDLLAGCLRDAEGATTTLCEWKGLAAYADVRIGPRRFRETAWFYPEPDPAYAVLRDHVAFFAGRGGRATVDGEWVRPQPGPFYGGWITDAIVGPFKGEPGTEGW